jgi:integrase
VRRAVGDRFEWGFGACSSGRTGPAHGCAQSSRDTRHRRLDSPKRTGNASPPQIRGKVRDSLGERTGPPSRTVHLRRPSFTSHGSANNHALSRSLRCVAPRTDVIGRWLASKRSKACVPSTVQRYQWVARRAMSFLKRAGRTPDPRRWSAQDVRWLRQCLKEERWQLSVLADLARFSKNLIFEEVGLPRPGPPQRVRWLSEETARALLQVARKDRLLRLVVLLGLGQGLRRIEWLRLRIGDIDLPGNRLLVRGKGRAQPKQVWMQMHPALPSAFQDYLELRESKVARFRRLDVLTPVPEELLIHRQGDRLVPYGEGGANRWMVMLQHRLAARGVHVRLSTHMLRRSGATLLERTLLRSPTAARDGVYRTVQGFLRHESIATTMRYLEADPTRQAEALRMFAEALPWNVSAGAASRSDALPTTRRRQHVHS